ncbi:hypothetical protein GT23_0902 [Parageobacillus thermoglucosidasius]|nr:hypothetical protein GT23_0902 [Parageobacillus thermoglucosidasius]
MGRIKSSIYDFLHLLHAVIRYSTKNKKILFIVSCFAKIAYKN